MRSNYLKRFIAVKVKFTKNGKQQFSCASCTVGSIPTNPLCVECFSIKGPENTSYRMLRWTNLFMVFETLSLAAS